MPRRFIVPWLVISAVVVLVLASWNPRLPLLAHKPAISLKLEGFTNIVSGESYARFSVTNGGNTRSSGSGPSIEYESREGEWSTSSPTNWSDWPGWIQASVLDPGESATFLVPTPSSGDRWRLRLRWQMQAGLRGTLDRARSWITRKWVQVQRGTTTRYEVFSGPAFLAVSEEVGSGSPTRRSTE